MRYLEAKKQMQSALKPEAGRPLANNTRLVARGKDFAIRLHSTDIITLHRNDTYTLHTGGWHTRTTKDRITAFAPVRLTSVKNVWYVVDSEWKPISQFYDGMKVNADGKVISRIIAPDTGKRKLQKLDKLIKVFIDSFCKAIESGTLPKPGAGDCFYCSMVDKASGRPLGECVSDTDHLISHLKERYLVPSLLVNAIVEAGYNVPSAILAMTFDHKESHAARTALRSYFRKRHSTLLKVFKSGRSD